MADLKLGPLPKQNAARVTIVLSEPLKEELDACADEHWRLYEPIEIAALMPHAAWRSFAPDPELAANLAAGQTPKHG